MRTVLITGGTGLVGTALAQHLIRSGYAVIILTRKLPSGQNITNLRYALWDVKMKQIDQAALADADIIVHLAGAGVIEKPWTAAYRKEIIQSRTDSSHLIIDSLRNYPNKVRTLISASAIGYYGEDLPGKVPFAEAVPAGTGFAAEVCRLWEESIEPVTALGKRLVKLRIGIVLSNNGGAFVEFKKPLRLGVAAILGSGRQMTSWIHIDDLCRMFIHVIENDISGTFNAVAPEPVSNKALTLMLAHTEKGNFFIPICSAFCLKAAEGIKG